MDTHCNNTEKLTIHLCLVILLRLKLSLKRPPLDIVSLNFIGSQGFFFFFLPNLKKKVFPEGSVPHPRFHA